jgi:hypothetical protein
MVEGKVVEIEVIDNQTDNEEILRVVIINDVVEFWYKKTHIFSCDWEDNFLESLKLKKLEKL